MEYNISARNTDHLLKERINKAAESANALLAATVRETCDEAALCAALREYVRVRLSLIHIWPARHTIENGMPPFMRQQTLISECKA